MKIPLNIPAGPRQREFIDYLNAALRKRMPTHAGSAGRVPGGNYVITASGLLAVDQNQVPLTIGLVIDSAGALATISVEATSETAADWQTASREFVTSVLASTIGEQRQNF